MPDIDLEPERYRWLDETRRVIVRKLRPLVQHHKTFMRVAIPIGIWTFFGFIFFVGEPGWPTAAVWLGPAIAFGALLITLDWMDDELD